LAYRELDDVLGLTDLAGESLSECRRGRNTRQLLSGLLGAVSIAARADRQLQSARDARMGWAYGNVGSIWPSTSSYELALTHRTQV
jgi:hypothetical protein